MSDSNVRSHAARPLWAGVLARCVLNFYEFEINVIE